MGRVILIVGMVSVIGCGSERAAESRQDLGAPAAQQERLTQIDAKDGAVLSAGSGAAAELAAAGRGSDSLELPRGRVGRLPFSRRDAPTRSGYYYIPTRTTERGMRVMVLFHGFNSTGHYVVELLKPYAEAHKIALVAPDSAGEQWQIPNRGGATRDSQYAQLCLDWLTKTVGWVDDEHVGAFGHSFGARMAAAVGTNERVYSALMMAHGRYTSESIGAHAVYFWMSGSPADNIFDYNVMVQQQREFNEQHPGWPGGGAHLHTYACGNCRHLPRQQELADVTQWFVTH